MVDELRRWPHAKPPFDRGSAHLTTDGPIHLLHQFAQGLGLRREWFQEHSSHPHYDLTPNRLRTALRHGAVFVPAREQIRQRRSRTVPTLRPLEEVARG